MKLSLKLKASSILALTFLIVYMLRPVEAQAPTNQIPAAAQLPSSQVVQQPITQSFAPGTPTTISTVSQGAMIGLLSSATCILAGVDPLQPQGKCIGVDPKSGALGYVEGNGGVAGTMGRLIGSTMNIPISSGQYGQYMAANFGGVNHAYAQTNGLGFDRLSPLIGVWARFRDIAYLIFVLAFTIIGFAIILRVKIDARTVMTIQNQIPKIIIALILVTFSYAIAGFLIDLMYVCMYVIILTFTNITPASFNPDANVFGVVNKAFNPGFPVVPNIGSGTTLPVEGAIGQIYNSGIMGIAGRISWTLAGVFTSLATDFIDSTVGSLMQGLFSPFGVLDLGCNALSFVGGFIPNVPVLSGIPVVGGLFGGDPSCNYAETFFRYTIQAIFTALIFLVVMVAIIFNLFRVWFTLIKSFMYILVDTMIAPLWIAAGIFPGSKLGFIPWVRHLSGHLSVFPTAFGVILLGKTMMDGIATGGTFFSPPLVGDAFGGNSAVAAFVGFGFILSIPTILDRVRTAIGAYSFGLKDIQAGFAAGQGVGKTALNASFGEYSQVAANGGLERMQAPRRIVKAVTGI